MEGKGAVFMADEILVAKGSDDLFIVPRMSNRHGLIAGATGTGKTVTLQTMAEGFSRMGVPVFMADVKGDLAGISQAGGNNANVVEREETRRSTNAAGHAGRLLGCLRSTGSSSSRHR